MNELLAIIILAVCSAPEDGGTTPCMESIVNCAVKFDGSIDEKSIQECIESYQEYKDG